MTRPQLKPYLLHWLNTHGGVWHKKVNLYFVGDEIEFSPESTGRALRDLAKEKKIHVNYYDGRWAKNLAKYSSLDMVEPIKIIKKPAFVERNGMMVAVFN